MYIVIVNGFPVGDFRDLGSVRGFVSALENYKIYKRITSALYKEVRLPPI